MAENEESLSGLTALINELYTGPSTDRIQEIQKILCEFERQSEAWKSSIYYIQHSCNEKVIMYCLSVIESTILRRWIILKSENKFLIRQFLECFILDDKHERSNFITLKASKALVDIARNDWPDTYPDFIDKVVYLIRSDSKTSLGLILLNNISEEFIHPHEAIESSRKLAIKQNLNLVLPLLLDALMSVANRLFGEKTIDSLTSLNSKIDESSYNVITQANKKLASFSRPALKICYSFLTVVNSLFSWLPMNTDIQNKLILPVFICSIGNHAQLPENESIMQEISIQSLNCLQELIERNNIVQKTNKFIAIIFNAVFYHLLVAAKFDKLASDEYKLKQTEILRFLIANYSSSMEAMPEFPCATFLNLLKEFTFQNTNCLPVYFSCLDAWRVYLEYLKSKSTANGKENFGEDLNLVFHLGESIITNTLFTESGDHMDELEDDMSDTLNDNEEDSEYTEFLRESFDVLSLVCEFCPNEMLQIASKRFFTHWETYLSVSGARIREHEMRKLHWALRDLATSMQIIGVIIAHVSVKDCFQIVAKLSECMLQSLTYGNSKSFYSSHVVKEKEIRLDFVQVQAQNLATLESIVSIMPAWLANKESQNYYPFHESAQKTYVETLMAVIASTLNSTQPSRLKHCAASLFYSICSTMRPPYLIKLSYLDDIYSSVKDLTVLRSFHLPTARILVKSLSLYLCIESSPIVQDRDLHLETFKANLHKEFLSELCNKCLNQTTVLNDKPSFRWCLLLMSDILLVTDQLNSFARRVCSTSYDENQVIQRLSALLPDIIGDPAICVPCLDFFINYTRTFGNIVSSNVIQGIIMNLLNSFNSEKQLDCEVMDSLLQILLVIIDYRQVFIPLVSNVIKLCLYHIYPNLQNIDSPDIRLQLYNVFLAIINNGFSYFFKAARPNNIHDGIAKRDSLTAEHSEEFTALMTAIGSAFMQADLEVVRASLKGLMDLHENRRLFSLYFFKENMLSHFFRAIMTCLIEKSHNLSSELMIQCLYKMCSSDPNHFFTVLLPNFVLSLENLYDSQRQSLLSSFSYDSDFPTFTDTIKQFVSDVTFYSMCNNSIAENATVFVS